jgi:hypothetical protein
MKRFRNLVISILLILKSLCSFSQDTLKTELIFSNQFTGNSINEGEKIEFDVKTNRDSTSFRYSLSEGDAEGLTFDSTGHFSWIPSFDFVDRLEGKKKLLLVFEAKGPNQENISKPIELTVNHVNRAPIVGELRPFYVQYNINNSYKPDPGLIKDEDNDPIVFIAIPSEMPEGARLSEQGEFTWKPSLTQFQQLKSKPIMVSFYVEDQPSKTRTKGKLKIDATQLDLPPAIAVIPDTNEIRYLEDATINLKFYLSDPNGDEDIHTFSFISENPNVPKNSLVKNTATQYEFIWTPGYQFVKDPYDSLTFNVTFFVIDKTQKRSEKKIRFGIRNAINEQEKDHALYLQYRSTLVKAWDLLEQLKDKEKELKKDYRDAKKGKKSRAIANASLGAVTGIVPVVNSIPTNTQRAVSAVGGTTVMTIGTLEATEVIGKSTRDLVERLNYVMDKKNEIQSKGDIFARKYSLKSMRRKQEFAPDVQELNSIMNLKGLVALELNAGWENKSKASDSNLQKTFKDFVPEEAL